MSSGGRQHSLTNVLIRSQDIRTRTDNPPLGMPRSGLLRMVHLSALDSAHSKRRQGIASLEGAMIMSHRFTGLSSDIGGIFNRASALGQLQSVLIKVLVLGASQGKVTAGSDSVAVSQKHTPT